MHEFVDVGALVEMTRELVAAPSENPPGDESKTADVARQLLEPFAASFRVVEPAAGRVSLVATVGTGDGSRPTLIVNGHLDVVPADPSAWTHHPYSGDVADGRVYGRGTADMKGGIAAAIAALAVLRQAGRDPACDIVFHLVADEETGGALGSSVLLSEGLMRGDACVDPEPTSLAVGVAERGVLRAAITTKGIPAHASQPHLGVSAIEKAAKIVLALQNADYGEEHPLLGRPSSNVGVIRGGTASNVVAEGCTLYIDRRVLPGTGLDAAVASIRRRIDAIDDPQLDYEIDVEMFGEASELSLHHPFLATFQGAYESALGAPGRVIGMQFTTDARYMRNYAGIPAIVCGPGELDQAHRIDESVAIDRLVDAAGLYAQLFATFSG